jgi:hypothetical protein
MITTPQIDLYQQKIAAAKTVRLGQSTAKADLQKHDIKPSEHNSNFSYAPQVRPSGVFDIQKPAPSGNAPRGNNIDKNA